MIKTMKGGDCMERNNFGIRVVDVSVEVRDAQRTLNWEGGPVEGIEDLEAIVCEVPEGIRPTGNPNIDGRKDPTHPLAKGRFRSSGSIQFEVPHQEDITEMGSVEYFSAGRQQGGE